MNNCLARRIYNDIKEFGLIEKLDVDEFAELSISEGRQILHIIIHLEENLIIRHKIYAIMEQWDLNFDPRLIILAV